MLQTDYEDIINEELRILKRTVQSEVFHFIIIQYNHYSLIQKTKDFLIQNFPLWAQKRFELTENEAYNFMPELLDCTQGFIFIERAEYLFTEPYKSICVGLNQRRDRYSMKPVQIIAFLPLKVDYIRAFRKYLPDVFSIVSPMLQLKKTIEPQQLSSNSLSFENTGYYPNAEEAQNDIERITERLQTLEKIEENKSLIIKLYFTLEKAYSALGNYSQALATLKEIEPEIDADEINAAVFNNNLGQTYLALGNLEQAKDYTEKALAIDLKNFGENHLNIALRYSNLGQVYQALGDFERVKEYTEKALDIDLKNFGKNHPRIAVYYSNLGVVYQALGDLEQAKKYTEKALSIDLKNFGEKHPQVATYLSNLGQIYQALGDLVHAKEYTERALDIDIKNFGDKHPKIAVYYSNLGQVYQALGDFEQAKAYSEKAMLIIEKSYGKQHPHYKTVVGNLEIINSVKS